MECLKPMILIQKQNKNIIIILLFLFISSVIRSDPPTINIDGTIYHNTESWRSSKDYRLRLAIEIKPEREVYSLGEKITIIYKLINKSDTPAFIHKRSSSFQIDTPSIKHETRKKMLKKKYNKFIVNFLSKYTGYSKCILVRQFSKNMYIPMKPGEVITKSQTVVCSIPGDLYFCVAFVNHYDYYLPEEILQKLKSPYIEDYTGKTKKLENVWRGAIWRSKLIKILPEPTKELEKHLKELMEKLSASAKIKKNDINNAIAAAPGYSAEYFLNQYDDISPENRSRLLEVLSTNIFKRDGIRIVNVLYDLYMSERKLPEKEKETIVKILKRAGDFIKVNEFEYRYKFKKEVFEKLQETWGNENVKQKVTE